MSLLDQVEQLKGKRGEKAIVSMLDRAEAGAAKIDDPVLRTLTIDAVSALRDESPKLAHLTGGALVSMLALVGSNRPAEAMRVYINPHMSTPELRRLSQQATKATYLATQAREEAWDSVLALLCEILSVTGSAILSVLIAAA